MTTPQDIIRAWCASCGMAEPSNGECLALLLHLFPAVRAADMARIVLPMPAEVPDWSLVPQDNGRLVTEAEKRRFEWQGLELAS